MRFTGTAAAITTALIVAAVSTLGDYIWYGFGVPHRAIFGLAHGAILFLVMGLCLGAVHGRAVEGGLTGILIGFVSAAAYYALAPLMGMASAMLAVWMAFWVLLAALTERLQRGPFSWKSVLVRGGIAAVLSGLAFYAISGIWLERPAGGRNYGVHFVSWTVAYLPAFLALVAGRVPRRVPALQVDVASEGS
jgi:hypothetical protein